MESRDVPHLIWKPSSDCFFSPHRLVLLYYQHRNLCQSRRIRKKYPKHDSGEGNRSSILLIQSVSYSLNIHLLGLTMCPGTGLTAGNLEMKKMIVLLFTKFIIWPWKQTFIIMQHRKWLGCGRNAAATPKRKQLILLRSFKKDQRTTRLFLWVINYDREQCSRG